MESVMSVEKIMKNYLIEHGYDGLAWYTAPSMCRCSVSDLFFCHTEPRKERCIASRWKKEEGDALANAFIDNVYGI